MNRRIDLQRTAIVLAVSLLALQLVEVCARGSSLLGHEIPAYLEFSSPLFTASEDEARALITINRTGEFREPVSVQYSTYDGTARAGQDYATTAGRLVIPAGVGTGTFSVPILKDDSSQGPRTVHLTLSQPSPHGLITRTNAVEHKMRVFRYSLRSLTAILVKWSLRGVQPFKLLVSPCALLLMLAWTSVVATLAEDDSARFYDPEVIQAIRLEIKPQDLERLHRALPERIYVPGTFRWNDQVLENVGVRYKGNSSSSPDAPFKRSFLISFAEFKKGQRFLGLRHAALDNGIQFGSLFSERLITDILRGVGVKASRCNYAQVLLNGQPAGVFVNVERIDQSFTERNFHTRDGVLFKVDEGGPGADLRYAGEDPAIYRKSMELHAGKEAKSFAFLVDFMRALNRPAGEPMDLPKHLDVDAFLKTTAVLLFAGAFDQYTGWGPHNYYLYRNPADQRWTYIPWDLDVGFADNAFGQVPVLGGWNAAWPVPVPGRPLMEQLVSDPVLLHRYREQASVILEAWFRPEVLIPQLHALYDQIRPALIEDPYPPRRVTVPSDSGFDDILASMEAFIRARYTLANAQLGAPGNRPAQQPMAPGPQPEGPTPGPPSSHAPSDLRAVKITPGGVELRWADHAEGEVAFVVQRCTGAECADFTNTIGQGGENIITATDRNVQAGTTYRYRVYAVLPTPQGPRGTGVSNSATVTIPKGQP